MPDSIGRYLPIIYVRGYAMNEAEQDDTTADPFCGFNLGSTVFRATPDKTKPPKKFVFESPVLRLTSDYGYSDAYHNGLDVLDPDWTGPNLLNPGTIPIRSILIYRYYDEASSLLGSGVTPPIEDFAAGLSRLILRVRELVCGDPQNNVTPDEFRCYLVAHSMGGLVCRAFLQNPALGDPDARRAVDKFFTYATPHNGIEMAGVNVPKWLSADAMNNFNRDRMAKYLNINQDLYKKTGRVDWLPESTFPSSRVFCMVGTNRDDYEVAKGLSRAFAGHGSDGLVRIDNASVWGVDDKGDFTAPAATAHTYRSHSGFFGIVNSEESYQNLTRFLFGDLRVDIWLDVDQVTLPPELQGKEQDVEALYQFELLTAPKGKRWYLSRRVSEEDSVACRTQEDLTSDPATGRRSIYLTTVFLSALAKVNPDDPSLNYAVTFGVRVPDYEVDRKFWTNSHFEGSYLFRDTLLVSITPPQPEAPSWSARYAWQSKHPAGANQPFVPARVDSHVQLTVPFDGDRQPGIEGRIRFIASRWNV